MFVLLSLFLTLVSRTSACSLLTLRYDGSDLANLDGVQFTALPVESPCHTSGRSCYTGLDSDGEEIFLYHTIESGIGRWIVSSTLGGRVNNSAILHTNSFSVAPQLVEAVSDGTSKWFTSNDDDAVDATLNFECTSGEPEEDDDNDDGNYASTPKNPDHTVYVDIVGVGWELAGFYVQVGSTGVFPVFSRVKVEEELQLYLYRLSGKWMIGEEEGVDAAHAFVNDPLAKFPSQIKAKEWLLSAKNMDTDKIWVTASVEVLSGSTSHGNEKTVYEVLREHRSIKFFPSKQPFGRLRNQIVIPYIGLGTGGIVLEDLPRVLTEAFLQGYRLLDLAREYGNEHIVRNVLDFDEHLEDSRMPSRHELFLISKIWPTFLGFAPTTKEILTSNTMLQSAYIDMHMLHWSECNPSISWMHCQDTVEPSATWKTSWRAMERAYAEGRIMSIGVSNFNVQQLREMKDFATVLPHAVQNHGEPGQMDLEVRIWCKEHRTLYIPYAAGRNIEHLSEQRLQALMKIASKYGKSIHAVTSRFFLQTGTAIIPRSTQREHLRENMAVGSWMMTDEEMGSLGWDVANDDADL